MESTIETTHGFLTGQCERCDWYVIKDSYPKLVTAYQSHLRAEHPKLWLRR